jgi:EAL domain-containing protein (putative c-di-GMP-specific phosphodiesterase class I)
MLELEVTEEASSGRPDRVVDVMTRLKAIGVTLAIDDFGTGYSSLAYLKRFPIDVLKIDRAFICQIGVSNQDQAIARMIMGMAHQFGFKVVAEGVETAEQWRILLSMKCDLLQGYYFSKPLPAADYQQFVAQGNSRG